MVSPQTLVLATIFGLDLTRFYFTIFFTKKWKFCLVVKFECPIIDRVLKTTFLLLFYSFYIQWFPEKFICNIAIYMNDIYLLSNHDMFKHLISETTWVGLWTWISSSKYCSLEVENGFSVSMMGKSTFFISQITPMLLMSKNVVVPSA